MPTNPTPDPIDRRAVSEIIEGVNKTLYSPTHPALPAVQEIAHRIAALPACPVAHLIDVTPEALSRAFDALNSPEERARHSWPQMMRDDLTMTESTPEVKRLLRDNLRLEVDGPTRTLAVIAALGRALGIESPTPGKEEA